MHVVDALKVEIRGSNKNMDKEGKVNSIINYFQVHEIHLAKIIFIKKLCSLTHLRHIGIVGSDFI